MISFPLWSLSLDYVRKWRDGHLKFDCIAQRFSDLCERSHSLFLSSPHALSFLLRNHSWIHAQDQLEEILAVSVVHAYGLPEKRLRPQKNTFKWEVQQPWICLQHQQLSKHTWRLSYLSGACDEPVIVVCKTINCQVKDEWKRYWHRDKDNSVITLRTSPGDALFRVKCCSVNCAVSLAGVWPLFFKIWVGFLTDFHFKIIDMLFRMADFDWSSFGTQWWWRWWRKYNTF